MLNQLNKYSPYPLYIREQPGFRCSVTQSQPSLLHNKADPQQFWNQYITIF